MRKILFASFFITLSWACSEEEKKAKEFPEYEGPTMEVDSSTILYSDSAVVRVKIMAPKQLEFENGDKEFPNTIFIEFFEPSGELSSTLEADKAFYTKETDLYKATGDVEVIGYLEPQKLNTEELFWSPKKEEIYTETFVRIETDDQISTGTGLTAKQDFSSYRILEPKGTIYLENDSSESNSSPQPEPIQEKKDEPKRLKAPDKKLLKSQAEND
ncbi:hypothetical protein GCM10027429_03440 [Marivirga atlantica]|uniref:LPS export ABC transporter periplasmic protein LptC n=1 Tax=Marivirga atlantica TaxID=1548457 RepID=A0A937DIA3_9BACT|nr:LPS export ABC transporter periplasmic protein LptC [Marivirga atlantica]MBL0763956.1 LPS export ABC transporter periplasmic protein LptC [Marivirga atlantica]